MELPQVPIVKWSYKDVNISMLRLDLTDRAVSGNKWFKLKYNLHEAKINDYDTILTFGGAFSNHIYATAAAAEQAGLKSIGIIRGEEALPLNDTLHYAQDKGMELHYVSRLEYRNKKKDDFLKKLQRSFGNFFLIPEGGSNSLAVRGAKEIVQLVNDHYDLWTVPVGTGGTLAGVVSGLKNGSEAMGFSALKGATGLSEDVGGLLRSVGNKQLRQWHINHDYHFGGYAKLDRELYDFIIRFKESIDILLDPIYTGKMMFGLYSLIDQGEIPAGKNIVAVHTGGLQGWNGMIRRYPFIDPSLSFD